ncbi:hypothetical protein E2C01_033200 [Portunus trituberculatus]|uniref:Uncharacterized protein n=1 Tax=Portunus trituberculatus TaxID=210409 RepID=A0A5B7F1U1_PORTR|nr:hypothetical protein [Portunus trituberculatus]
MTLLSIPFHTSTHLCGKLSFLNFFPFPFVPLVSQISKSFLTNFSSPFIALYTAIRSSLSILCSKFAYFSFVFQFAI